MNFRTEISVPRAPFEISHGDGIVMLGSCFTDEVGALLDRDGFMVTHNPMGPLYNPESVLRCLRDAVMGRRRDDYVIGPDAKVHCLSYATRFTADDEYALDSRVDEALDPFADFLYEQATTLIVTLGSAYVYYRADNGAPVGNCHKFPASFFKRERLSVDRTVDAIGEILSIIPETITKVIFTVSPIRHTADGLHANQLSKATLLLAIDSIDDPRVTYFPAYETLLDDLRDYRFYAADMKHPSDVAVEYIYELFSNTYFNSDTKAEAQRERRLWLSARHRPNVT
ncbi:MAG: GSCFA domain-containing protein [Bacteroides sp.]|nr:GSCFA domain-containing protein [Bacteroides sp.]MCM1458163.1 GSCFA domain-containing protein [Lachnoclostridium sp.]